jgi:RNA polymerase sigma-70 factor (ECF subfamily)
VTGRPSARAPAAVDEPIAGEDPAAAFVRRHQRGVWRFLRALGCPAHAAEEIAQDAFLLALDHDVTDAVAPAFLRQAAKFLWLRKQRDEGRAAQRLAAAAERLWQRDCARDDGEGLLAALRRCVEALPERSRLVVELVYRDDASRADVARELQLTEHGARALLQRLRGALRQCVERRLES